MKAKKVPSFLGLLALVLAFGVVVMGCDSVAGDNGDLPIKTVNWAQDSNEYAQFYTNDAAKYSTGNFGTVSHSGDTYETEVKKMSGAVGQGYGMTFLYDSPNDNYLICIATNGGYRIDKTVGGVDTVIKGWTQSTAIVQGFEKTNKLKAVKSGNNFTVYINNTQVDTFTSSDNTGTKIGGYAGISTSANESFPNIPVDVRFKVLQ